MIKRTTLAREIAHTVEGWIFQEVLKPGDQIRELLLARKLGTSQSPVREALKILEERGLVTHTIGKGTLVVDLSEDDVVKILIVRLRLESLALFLAKKFATKEDYEQLETLLTSLTMAADEDDLLEYHEAHTAFHRQMWVSSHNQYLAATLERLCAPLWAFYRQRVRDNSARSLSGGPSHKPLVAFITNKSTLSEAQLTTAERLMEVHFENVAGFEPSAVAK